MLKFFQFVRGKINLLLNLDSVNKTKLAEASDKCNVYLVA